MRFFNRVKPLLSALFILSILVPVAFAQTPVRRFPSNTSVSVYSAAEIDDGSALWNNIGDPDGNQTLEMGSHTTTWNSVGDFKYAGFDSWTFGSGVAVHFRDTAITVQSDNDGDLDIDADTSLDFQIATVEQITLIDAILQPTLDSDVSFGTTSLRWSNIFTDSITSGTLVATGGSITDTSGAISFGNENLSTTGLVTAGNLDVDTLNLNGNVISDSTGEISFGNDNLTTTGSGTFENLDVDTLNLNSNNISDSTGVIDFPDKISVGPVTTNASRIHIADTTVGLFRADYTGASASNRGAGFLFYSLDGQPLGSGHRIFFIAGGGSKSGAATLANGFAITAFTTELWDTNGVGTEIRFETTDNNSTSRLNRLTIENNGDVTIESGDLILDTDNKNVILGEGQDASLTYDGTNMLLDPDVVGSGRVLIGATGDDDMLLNDIEIDGDLNHDGSNIGFFGTAPTTQQTALTTQDTSITHTAPGTPDFAIQNFTQTTPFGFVTADEANTVLQVVLNLQTRVQEIETKLKAYGLLA